MGFKATYERPNAYRVSASHHRTAFHRRAYHQSAYRYAPQRCCSVDLVALPPSLLHFSHHPASPPS